MNRFILAIGITILFILSALAPMSLGYNVKSSIYIPDMETTVPPFEDPPNEVWNRTYGGTGTDDGVFVQQTSDDGYIIVGTTRSYGAGSSDVWLIKTDIDGNMIWNKTFGGRYKDVSRCVRETNDRGFIIAGYYSNGNNGPYDVWLIKTDENGTMQWDRKYPGPVPKTFGNYVIEVDDGYLISANMWKELAISNIWLVKTDFEGNEIWNKTVGETDGSDHGNSVIQTKDGDFVIIGYTWIGMSQSFDGSTIPAHKEILMIKTDENGNRLWRRTYDGSGYFDIIEIDDGYMIAGGTAGDAYLIKTNYDGKELWRKTYYRFGDYWASSFVQTSDGGYILAGTTANVATGFDVFIFKTDADGNKFWETIIGGEERDVAVCVIRSNDGNYVIVGTTESFGAGGWDVWLIKMAPLENIRPNKPSKPVGPTRGLPMTGYNFTTSSSDPDGELVYFTWDWGNGCIDYKLGPYDNDKPCTLDYGGWVFWGIYNIKVKAVDAYGGESDWSDPLKITIPRNRASIDSNWLRLLEVFPLLKEVILRLIR